MESRSRGASSEESSGGREGSGKVMPLSPSSALCHLPSLHMPSPMPVPASLQPLPAPPAVAYLMWWLGANGGSVPSSVLSLDHRQEEPELVLQTLHVLGWYFNPR